MELIAAVIFAGPLGYLVPGRTRAHGLTVYLVLWAVIFPIQMIAVHAENPNDIVPSYFVVNALILVAGIALNSLGARLRERRKQRDDDARRAVIARACVPQDSTAAAGSRRSPSTATAGAGGGSATGPLPAPPSTVGFRGRT